MKREQASVEMTILWVGGRSINKSIDLLDSSELEHIQRWRGRGATNQIQGFFAPLRMTTLILIAAILRMLLGGCGGVAGGADECGQFFGAFSAWLCLDATGDVYSPGIEFADRFGDVVLPEAARDYQFKCSGL